MNFSEAISAGFAGFFDFETRSQRSAYWYWTLFVLLVGLVTGFIDIVIFGPGVSIFNILSSLVLLIPGLAVSVRRLHDIDRSGWWLLLALIPVIGWFVLIYWAVQAGTDGDNDFGSDPVGVGSQQPEISVR